MLPVCNTAEGCCGCSMCSDQGEVSAKLTEWYMSRKLCRLELSGLQSEPSRDSHCDATVVRGVQDVGVQDILFK